MVNEKLSTKDEGLPLDQKFQKMALASRQKFINKNKISDYRFRLPFKSQLSAERNLQLYDVKDGEQLDNIKSHLWKMERELFKLLNFYEDDAKVVARKN